MFVSIYNVPLNPITPEAQTEASEGRWWHFRRVYIVKDENEKVYSVRLNWFERILVYLRYGNTDDFFKNVFQDKKIDCLTPKIVPIIDLSTITPANFAKTIEIELDRPGVKIEPDLEGNIRIFKQIEGYAFSIRFHNEYMPEVPGYSSIHVSIKEDQFIVHPQLRAKDVPYKNLKEVLDHCFRGEYYQEDIYKTIPLFTLTQFDGSTLTYKNPFL